MNVAENQIQIQGPCADERRCLHCGTELKPTDEQYCCTGCAFVSASIHALGLEAFYSKKINGESPGLKAQSDKSYSYLSEPEVIEQISELTADGKVCVRFYLPTIHCAACVWILEKLPQVVSGIYSSRVSYATGGIEILTDPNILAVDKLASLLHSIGYPPVPAVDSFIQRREKQERTQSLMRIGVTAVCAANTMMLADSLFQSFFTGMDAHFIGLFTWVSAIIALPAVTWGAYPFYRTAVGSLMTGRIHMDLPISIAIIATYISDIVTVSTGGAHVYFDSITSVIFLLLTARYIQRQALTRSRASTSTVWDLFPATVRLCVGEEFVEKRLSEIERGDIVEVRPEERIPCDGSVESGRSFVNTSFLTGESRPIEVGPGDRVLGGTLNIDGLIRVQITETGSRSRLGKIVDALRRSQSEASAVEDRANRLSGYFSLSVLFLSLMTYGYWYYVDPTQALPITVSLLVITCPCALGLSVPATIAVALRQARTSGLFISSSASLESLAGAKHFYFDKTGTLTTGILSVHAMEGPQELLPIVHALAHSLSSHPVSHALEKFCESTPAETLRSAQHVPGSGITAYTDSGRITSLGSLRWFRSRGVIFNSHFSQLIAKWLDAGMTPSLLELDGRCVAAFALRDELRPQSRHVVESIRQFGASVEILSGDAQKIVNAVAQELELPLFAAKGDLYPEEKAQQIASQASLTVFVGDGLNDALSLDRASVGIALRGGIEAAIEAADIYVAHDSIEAVETLIRGAKKVRSVIFRNLSLSTVYNVAASWIAISGHATPLLAALMMPLSSFVVIVSAATPRYFGASGNKQWR